MLILKVLFSPCFLSPTKSPYTSNDILQFSIINKLIKKYKVLQSSNALHTMYLVQNTTTNAERDCEALENFTTAFLISQIFSRKYVNSHVHL